MTMVKPSISVVIPLYNKRQYIERTLRSVAGQSFDDFEIIVVNDGSSDGGDKLVGNFPDDRIRLVTQENGGVSLARNRGISEAQADYVAFLDADDEWKPRYLETVWRLKKEFPAGRIFATSYEIRYVDGKKFVPQIQFAGARQVDLSTYIDHCTRHSLMICSSAIMCHKPLLEMVGMFPVGQKRGEDLDTWFRLLLEGPLIYFNEPLSVYWYGLPASACVASGDTFLENNALLASLENNLRAGAYEKNLKMKILDYIAWYMVEPISRMLAAGRADLAGKYILSGLRSRRFKKQYILMYLNYLSVFVLQVLGYGE